MTRIPAGSSSLDIRQRGFQGSNRDDNYLALLDPQTGEYLLNGNFVVSMFQKTIQFGGTTIEYTGSDAVVERLNSSKPLKKDVVIQVGIFTFKLFPFFLSMVRGIQLARLSLPGAVCWQFIFARHFIPVRGISWRK